MNPFLNAMKPMQNVMNIMQQVRQIKQNPNQLVGLLQQRGMISENQAKDIKEMGSDYEKIGRYLMDNGKIPNNVQQYSGQVEQIQNMMK